MKKLLCLLLSALLLLSLAACAGSGSTETTKAPERTTPALSGKTETELPEPEHTVGAADSGNQPAETEAPETESAEPSATEAPEPPATEPSAPVPPGTDAPAPVFPVTDAPETDAPATDFPATDAPETGTPDTDSPAPGPDEDADPYAFEEEADFEDFLCGAWNFFPVNEGETDTPEIGGIPGLTIQLVPGGMFMAILHMDFTMYTGTWTLERLYADEDALPDLLRFELDEEYEDLAAFGDFCIQGWASCTGSERLSLVQVNNGDSVLNVKFDLYDAMLIKGGDFPTDESAAPQTDAHFCAMVWQVADGGNTLWVTEVSPQDFSVTVGSHEAVRYTVSGDAEIRCPASAFARGGLVAEIEADAEGNIVMLNWAEPELEYN